MKVKDLKKGIRYWCGWACRYAYFQEIRNGEAIFTDICDAIITCKLEYIEKWVEIR